MRIRDILADGRITQVDTRERFIKELILVQLIGEDEDLIAPPDKAIDGNPEGDKYPDLYMVRRATRNLHRGELRQRASDL